MSAPSGDKQSKAKSKKSTIKSAKQAKGKEGPVSDEKFRGDGVSFKCKLLGVSEVIGPRGDDMCIEAIKKLKQHIRQTGEHKMKIILNVTLKGIRIFDDRAKKMMFEHPVNKVSFITHDPDDKKVFGYVSSARCKTGHMMYAIKYDKVAGVITATLYELFQAVFKLRQEAAQQKRAQVNAQASPTAIAVPVSNGPSAASSVDETNIYEEPKSTPTPETTPADSAPEGHYKVPPTRPLPPAPYTSPTAQDSPQVSHQDTKTTNQLQSTDSPATSFSMPSDSFFGASVFAQPDSTSDTVSMSSVDIIRKESMSSSSSETASYDTKSLDLKAGPSASTPPVARERPVGLTCPPVPSLETPAIADEDHDYETIPSSDYETIPNIPKPEKKVESASKFKSFNFGESFSEIEASPRIDSLNDPFDSKNSKVQENPSSGAFGNDDLFKGFGDSNFDDMALATSSSDFPADDPFAPTTATTIPQESQPQTSVAFASSDLFETAFGLGKMSPVPFAPAMVPDEDTKVVEGQSAKVSEESEAQKKQAESLASSNRFEAAFDSGEMSPQPFKPVENLQHNTEKDLNAAWSNSAVEENQKMTVDKKDQKSEKSEESKMEFKWDDSFEAKIDIENEKGAGSNSAELTKDVSWSTAFDTKPQSEVSFSWDDAFGAPIDSKDGETKNDFGAVSFEDAFPSTPFKDSDAKPEPAFHDSEDSFSNFGTVALTPIVQDLQKKDSDLKDEVSGETTTKDSKADEKELSSSGDSQQKQISEKSKAKLAGYEDLSSSSDIENGSEENEKTVPKIVEPVNVKNDNATSGEETRPTSLPILPIKPNQDVVTSPNVPPPLPPRAKAALPVLPPRPRTYSSPVASQIPPTPPRPEKSPAFKGQSKRAPPALPPRIDLELGKARSNSNAAVPVNASGFNSGAFISPNITGPSGSWQTNLGENPLKEDQNKENLTNSKTSPDPFGDDFFTDFNFSAVKDTDTKSNESTLNNQNLFSDPFLAKEGADDMFKDDFGGEDPFADFTSNNKGKTNDPFTSHGGDAFPGFSTTNDPFSDVNDPFAEKITVNADPFGDNPKKEDISFYLSKDSSDGDFADSFA